MELAEIFARQKHQGVVRGATADALLNRGTGEFMGIGKSQVGAHRVLTQESPRESKIRVAGPALSFTARVSVARDSVPADAQFEVPGDPQLQQRGLKIAAAGIRVQRPLQPELQLRHARHGRGGWIGKTGAIGIDRDLVGGLVLGRQGKGKKSKEGGALHATIPDCAAMSCWQPARPRSNKAEASCLVKLRFSPVLWNSTSSSSWADMGRAATRLQSTAAR